MRDPFTTALPLAALLFAPRALAQQPASEPTPPGVHLHPIALSGETAPGTGTPFVDFLTAFGSPATTAPPLDAAGNAGVFATVVDPGDPESVLGGVWKERDGALELVALEGQTASGPSDSFEAFPNPFFEIPPLVAGGTALFHAETTTSELDVWTDRGGLLELVARDGWALPGGPQGEVFEGPLGTPFADGSVLVASRWSGFRGDEGFWRDAGSSLELVVRAGLPAPGMDGAFFADAESLHLEGPFDRWDTDSRGLLVFNGTVGGEGIDRPNDEGIWIETAPGAIELALAEGDPAPELGSQFRFGIGSGVRAFGGSQRTAVRVNDAGTILFGAGMHGGPFDHVNALWRRTADGALELIASAEEPWSGFPGTVQPGTGAPFHRFFLHATINSAGRVAFQDVIPHELNDFYNQETAIFWDQPGELDLLVATETWIPGLGTGELIDSLSLGELLDGGWLFAVAKIKDDVGSAFPRALLLFAPDGSPTVLMREGESVDLGGGDVRQLDEMGLGGFNQRAHFGLFLTFTDGSSGVFRLEVRRGAGPTRR